jgi:hypothetical protein
MSTISQSTSVSDARMWMTMRSFSFELGLGTTPCPTDVGMPCIREENSISPACSHEEQPQELPLPQKFPSSKIRSVHAHSHCSHSSVQSARASDTEDVIDLASTFLPANTCIDELLDQDKDIGIIFDMGATGAADDNVRHIFRRSYNKSIGLTNESERRLEILGRDLSVHSS